MQEGAQETTHPLDQTKNILSRIQQNKNFVEFVERICYNIPGVDDKMLEHWVWLAECKISLRRKAILIKQYQDAEYIYQLDEPALSALGLDEKEIAAMQNKDLSEARSILEVCLNKGIRLLTYQDDAYPDRLREIAEPPVLLYYKGQFPQFDRLPAIAAIGARKMTAHGYKLAQELGYQMGCCGLTVISGIAAGIDAASLTGALLADAPVAAVLGCGADVVYPAANRKLYTDVELEGCLLTEYPPGSRPEPWHFPVRNRIIAGLSVGVLVVEAGEKSGALITVRHALDQGKDIFAVPNNADSPAAMGSNRLLQEGAICASTGWEVAREYQQLYPEMVHPYRPPYRRPTPSQRPKRAECAEQKPPVDPQPPVGHRDWEQLSDAERKVFVQLHLEPVHVDQLIERTGLPASQVLSALTLFEIQGVAKRLPGKRFQLARQSPLLILEEPV